MQLPKSLTLLALLVVSPTRGDEAVKRTENLARAAARSTEAKAYPATNPRLLELQKRARLVHKNNARFHRDMLDGKVRPWQQLQQRYKGFAEEFPNLDVLKGQIFNEKDPVKRRELILAFQLALQPLGPYLQSADYAKADMSITAKQMRELKQLQAANPQVDEASNSSITAITPQHAYTFTYIAVPIEVIVPPHADVYLSTEGGGEFSNGITRQLIKADAQGVARASWLTKGDAVDTVLVELVSPQCSNRMTYEIEVVKLALKPLPSMPEFQKMPEKARKSLEAAKAKIDSSKITQSKTSTTEANK